MADDKKKKKDPFAGVIKRSEPATSKTSYELVPKKTTKMGRPVDFEGQETAKVTAKIRQSIRTRMLICLPQSDYPTQNQFIDAALDEFMDKYFPQVKVD